MEKAQTVKRLPEFDLQSHVKKLCISYFYVAMIPPPKQLIVEVILGYSSSRLGIPISRDSMTAGTRAGRWIPHRDDRHEAESVHGT